MPKGFFAFGEVGLTIHAVNRVEQAMEVVRGLL
jgi:hypothetical protein